MNKINKAKQIIKFEVKKIIKKRIEMVDKDIEEKLGFMAAKGRLASGDMAKCIVNIISKNNNEAYNEIADLLTEIEVKVLKKNSNEIKKIVNILMFHFHEKLFQNIEKISKITKRQDLEEWIKDELKNNLKTHKKEFYKAFESNKEKNLFSKKKLILIAIILSVFSIPQAINWHFNPNDNFEPSLFFISSIINTLSLIVSLKNK
jgi:hypothetical protein